jgi:hypothetical protein
MIGTETKLPIVMCPGCDQPMKAIERKLVAFSHGLVDVTYWPAPGSGDTRLS